MYEAKALHVENLKSALQHVLNNGNLNLREKIKVQWTLKSDRRLKKLTPGFAVSMTTGRANAAEDDVVVEDETFLDKLQNWIDFLIENQDKIAQIIEFFSKLFFTV